MDEPDTPLDIQVSPPPDYIIPPCHFWKKSNFAGLSFFENCLASETKNLTFGRSSQALVGVGLMQNGESLKLLHLHKVVGPFTTFPVKIQFACFSISRAHPLFSGKMGRGADFFFFGGGKCSWWFSFASGPPTSVCEWSFGRAVISPTLRGSLLPRHSFSLSPTKHVKSPTSPTYFMLTGGNWQKWKRVFLICPCHKIYRNESVGLKSCKYTWKLTKFVKMGNMGQYRENLIFCQ